MKTFWLSRKFDVSGSSGTGVVAEGVMFSDGRCAMHWLTETTSVAIYDNIKDLETIHGHGGATKVVWRKPRTKREKHKK